jgi:hypothetical protein
MPSLIVSHPVNSTCNNSFKARLSILRACWGELHAAPDPQKQLHSIFSYQTPELQKLLMHQIHGSSSQLHQIHGVPQGVLCEALFCTHSWSWVEITHLCHPLHNIQVRSIFPPPRDPSPPHDPSSPAPPPFT